MALKIQEWNPELGNYEVFHHYGTPDGQLMDGKDPSIGTGIQNNLNIPIGGGENVYYIPGSSAETRDNNFWTLGGATGGMDSIEQLIAQQNARATYGLQPALPAENMPYSQAQPGYRDSISDLIQQRTAGSQDSIGQLIQQLEPNYNTSPAMVPASQGGFSAVNTNTQGGWLQKLRNLFSGNSTTSNYMAPTYTAQANTAPGTAPVAPTTTAVNNAITNSVASTDPTQQLVDAANRHAAAQNGMKINPETGQWDPLGWDDLSINQKLNTGFAGAKGIWDIYSGFKNMGLAKKQMDQQRNQWNKTYAANAKAQNANSWLRAANLNNGNFDAARRQYEQDRISERG